MNLFNCYQALAFYTLTPFAIQWLSKNNYGSWAIVLGIAEVISFIFLGYLIHDRGE